MHYYSESKNAFFLSSLKAAYQASGQWPSDAVEVTSEEWKTYGKSRAPEGMQRGADENGRPTWASVPPPDLDTLATRQRAAVATALADALAAGMPYTMPDGTEDTVQMLAEDRQNLLGLAIEARDLKAAGVTDPAQEFRAASNTRYPMTPDQVIALTDAALSHYKVLKARSWDLKDQVTEALKLNDREAIENLTWNS